ncbi:MAG: DUF4097 domain-containing protein [Chloroflexi bacterium]|nr:DUF4097 domain-containing protein [Chloroflexota bacterium]
MRLDSRFLNWGLFFIVTGAVPLAVQQGLLGRDIAVRAWQLWPLLIVAAGVGLLLRRTTLEFLGGVIVAVTFGAMLGGVIAVGAELSEIGRSCGSGETRAFASQQGSLGGSARVRVDLNCGDVNVGTAAGSGWTLSGSSTDGELPRISSGSDRLTIESKNQGGVFFFGPSHRDSWTVTLPTDPTIDIEAELNAADARFALTGARLGRTEMNLNAGSLRLDLTDFTLSRLDVHVNAGSARMTFPASGFSGSLEVNAGSIAFCVPEGVGLRISTNANITGSNNFDQRGLSRSGSTWETANFSGAASRIDLTSNANAASLTLNPEDGCR